jgi:hypothetical protein
MVMVFRLPDLHHLQTYVSPIDVVLRLVLHVFDGRRLCRHVCLSIARPWTDSGRLLALTPPLLAPVLIDQPTTL